MTLIKIKDNKSTQNIIEKLNEHIERYWNANSNKPVSFLRVNYKHDKIDYHNSYSMFKKLIQKINYFYKTKYNDYPNYKEKMDTFISISISFYKSIINNSNKLNDVLLFIYVMLYRCFLDSTRKNFSKNYPDKSLTYIAVPSFNDKSISYNILLFDFIEIDNISLIDILGIDLIKNHLSDSLFDDLKSVSDIIDVFKMPANLILPFSMQPIESETDLSKIIDRFFIDNIKKNHGNNIGSKNYFHSNYK